MVPLPFTHASAERLPPGLVLSSSLRASVITSTLNFPRDHPVGGVQSASKVRSLFSAGPAGLSPTRWASLGPAPGFPSRGDACAPLPRHLLCEMQLAVFSLEQLY